MWQLSLSNEGSHMKSKLHCYECGWRVEKDTRCPQHPDIGKIEVTQAEEYADNYIRRMWEAGEDPEEFVRTFNPRYFPGVTQEDMDIQLSRMQRWGRLTGKSFNKTTPAGLFG